MTHPLEKELREEWDKYRGRYDGLQGLEADEVADFWLSKIAKEREAVIRGMVMRTVEMLEQKMYKPRTKGYGTQLVAGYNQGITEAIKSLLHQRGSKPEEQ